MKAIKQFLGLTFVAVSLIPFFTKEEAIIYFLAGILGGIGLVIAEE